MKHIIMAAGGTGGHMFPAQALAEVLTSRGWKISLVTDDRGLKYAQAISAENRFTVASSSIAFKKPWTWPVSLWKMIRGFVQARRILKQIKPGMIVGFGGYASFPVLAAARFLDLPFIIQEQNAVLGRVNRYFARQALAVVSGFQRLDHIPSPLDHMPLGNPLRQAVLDLAEAPYPAITEGGTLRLLVLGGSLGARLLSETVPEAIARLPSSLRERLQIVQQTRQESLDKARAVYQEAGVAAVCEPFFEDIAHLLAETHYVIARAGASTVSELAVMGRPAILVPLALAMDDHQRANAGVLAEARAADVLTEQELTLPVLAGLRVQRLWGMLPQKERIVSQPAFFRGELSNFGGCTWRIIPVSTSS